VRGEVKEEKKISQEQVFFFQKSWQQKWLNTGYIPKHACGNFRAEW